MSLVTDRDTSPESHPVDATARPARPLAIAVAETIPETPAGPDVPDTHVALDGVVLARPVSDRNPGAVWNLSERKAFLLLVDLAIVAGAMLSTQLVAGTVATNEPSRVAIWVAVLVVLWVVISRALDCYDLAVASRPGDSIRRVCLAAICTMGVYLLIPRFSPPLPVARTLLAGSAAALFVPLVAWRAGYALLLTRPNLRSRAVIIGSGSIARTIARLVQQEGRNGYELAAVVDESAAATLAGLVRTQGVRDVIVCNPAGVAPAMRAALIEMAEQGISVVSAAEVYESLTGRALLESGDPTWLSHLSATSRLYGIVRRLVDIVVAVVGLLVAVPVLLVVAAVIVLDTPGAPFFWQERVGLYGRRFRILKLRSMVQDAEADGRARWATAQDPRITRTGRFLRRSRLDEVPQLWNVLRGEMSLIGPRPERPTFVDLIAAEMPMYRTRHVVPPGLTGWAQVKYRYGASVDDAGIKLSYDLYYVKHRSLLLDATILLKTVAVVLGFKGR